MNKTMNYFKSFSKNLIFLNEMSFEEKAMELFKFQAANNIIYKNYIKARGIEINSIHSLHQIPFLPIRFFKDHKVVCGNQDNFSDFFSSSGTTGQITSKHYIWSNDFYLHHSLDLFERSYGSISDFHVLALLPSYLERKGSSLVEMARFFIARSNSIHSGFFLYEYKELLDRLRLLSTDNKKVLLLGVSFALLELIAYGGEDIPQMKNLIVMETGGMKGRRKEMIREELHEIIQMGFGVNLVHSEYGMTELMSQAYSKGNGVYQLPLTMKIFLRDLYDPFSYVSLDKNKIQGAINIIDLANFHSCAFIETQDLGRLHPNGIEILGRVDNSDIRGCNLLIN
jgi:phenylacetate-coenzyme A ligase PaaK-like adenylate-forming protein